MAAATPQQQQQQANNQEQLRKRLNKYETTQVIGMRAEQLANCAPPMIDVTDPSESVYSIAERELEAGRLPFIVVRRMPDGKPERIRIWR